MVMNETVTARNPMQANRESRSKSYGMAPGLAAVIAIAVVSVWGGALIGTRVMGFDKSPVSPGLVAIILGLLIGNLMPGARVLGPGAGVAAKRILRLGIVLLGIRLSLSAVLMVGAKGVGIVMGCIAGGLGCTLLLGRVMRLPHRLGTLIGVGTSICGVSAITATGPAIEAEDEEISYAISVITVFGIFATLVYPYLANILFDGDPERVGFFLGTAIHDTSQVTGAGVVFADTFDAPRALNVATVTKLVRNLFMAVVIPFSAWLHARQVAHATDSGARPRWTSFFPLFVLGFVLLAALRSAGDMTQSAFGSAFGFLSADVWTMVIGALKQSASWLLVIALAGVGLKTRFGSMRAMGLKPFIAGLGAALAVGVISVVLISLLNAAAPV
jgi:uncharacterized integral membrane protein (TIGR00698 family)